MATVVFNCDHCDAAFTSYDDLLKHKEIVIAAGERWPESWICPKCAARFSSPGQLKEHEDRRH